MSYGRVSGRVVRRKNKTGYSYNFLIVKNQRNYMTGKSEHLLVANLGTVKDSEFERDAKSFWRKVDATISILIDTGEIDNCRSKICGKFGKVLPRPAVTVAAPTPAAKPLSKTESNPVAARLRARFKGLL